MVSSRVGKLQFIQHKGFRTYIVVSLTVEHAIASLLGFWLPINGIVGSRLTQIVSGYCTATRNMIYFLLS